MILPPKISLIFLYFFSLFCPIRSLSADHPHEDLIRSLPGLNFTLNFDHYSGYLKASSTHFFHYWFITSQNNPSTDPLVFWFNGGPGCSSLDGLLNEMGPYQTNSDGRTLRSNRFSWNKYASFVYIESPAGVGFSYSADGFSGFPSDDSTSSENYEAFKQFFDKFPTFRLNRVFILGESYAGVYVPTLVERILDGIDKFPVILEGMAIGNGCMNKALDTDTLVRFAYGHGLIGEAKWKEIEDKCCKGCADNCDLSQVYGDCETIIYDIIEFCWMGGLNVYDLYRTCDWTSERNSVKLKAIRNGIFRAKTANSNDGKYRKTQRVRPNPQKSAPINWDNRIGQRHFFSGVPCLDDSPLVNYLNLPQVRQALNIPANEIVPNWDICNDWINMVYSMQYPDVSSLVQKALRQRVRVLLYYGDTDMACNFLQGQKFAAQLGIAQTSEKIPWHFAGQIAGFKTSYEKNLTFITVRGAGHMAPQWRAPQMDYVIRQFLSNQKI